MYREITIIIFFFFGKKKKKNSYFMKELKHVCMSKWTKRELLLASFILLDNERYHKCFFFFFERKFQLMASILDDGLYHQTKITIGFWCRWRLNPRFLIQLSETLPVELTGTHNHTISVETILFQFYIITRCVLFLLFT